MGKILALDFGTKRIGYAVSDEEQKVAFPRETFSKMPRQKLIDKLRKIAKEENIRQIVIGLPLDENNEETPTAAKIKQLGATLARSLMLPIAYVDEFGSTNEALAKIPFRKDRRREQGQRDAVAAQVILQRYLDAVILSQNGRMKRGSFG